ncbi:hypothetical protein JCM10450v2_002127 [Rhodotorula kratochvilovae]
MLKAKAKAAATAAAQKRKAAAAAAAAQEAAAQQAAQAATAQAVPNGPRGSRGRAGVTQFWADSPAARLAAGGSIQRIGYDAAAFDEAVRVVILGEAPAEGNEVEQAAGVIPAAATEGEKEVKEVKEVEGAEGYKTNKEDLATVVDALDVPSALASQTLRAHKGDLAATLAELAGTRQPAAVSA